jgi:hypothetical protein
LRDLLEVKRTVEDCLMGGRAMQSALSEVLADGAFEACSSLLSFLPGVVADPPRVASHRRGPRAPVHLGRGDGQGTVDGGPSAGGAIARILFVAFLSPSQSPISFRDVSSSVPDFYSLADERRLDETAESCERLSSLLAEVDGNISLVLASTRVRLQNLELQTAVGTLALGAGATVAGFFGSKCGSSLFCKAEY